MKDYSDLTHVGPGTLAGTFLRQYWQPVMVGSELVVGRPQRLQVFNQHYTAYRGEDGAAHIVQDACPHRQTRLCLGSVEGSDIRCFYHGWKFSPDGKCVEQPAEDPAYASKIKIDGHPTREVFGFIFAYLGEGEAPEFPEFPEINIEKDSVRYFRHPVHCNYFQRIENDMDELHVHFVHKVSTDAVGFVEFPRIEVSETDYGLLRKGYRQDSGQNVTHTAYWMAPNSLMTFVPGKPSRPQWTVHLAWRVPITDTEMASFIVSTEKNGGKGLIPLPAINPPADHYVQEILAGRMRVQDIDKDYPGLFQVQDNVALMGQGEIVDRAKDRLGQSDKAIVTMRRLWERELRCIAEGRPTKQWRRPKESFFQGKSNELILAGVVAAE